MPEDEESLKRGSVDQIKQKYLESLLSEQKDRYDRVGENQIRTIYIGGGTPFQLGVERLFELIDSLLETRDTEFLEELSIELNPDPFDEVIDFIKEAQKKYKHLFRLRFSFGIQTFNDEILSSSKRNYVFNNLINFLREIAEIKENNTIYNLDFIAFGNQHIDSLKTQKSSTQISKKEQSGISTDDTRLPRDQIKRDFFEKIVSSKVFDGYSVYTLELFPGAEWYYDMKRKETRENKGDIPMPGSEHLLRGPDARQDQQAILSDDPTIWKEFARLKKILLDGGYRRYEISNFALSGKRSLHNMVYWEFGEYLGLGINASGMLMGESTVKHLYEGISKTSSVLKDTSAVRYKNTTNWKKYLAGEWREKDSLIELPISVMNSEKVMLLLRTDKGIVVDQFRDVLVDNVDEIIADLVDAKFVAFDQEKGILKLRSKGLDVYNAILLEVIEEL